MNPFPYIKALQIAILNILLQVSLLSSSACFSNITDFDPLVLSYLNSLYHHASKQEISLSLSLENENGVYPGIGEELYHNNYNTDYDYTHAQNARVTYGLKKDFNINLSYNANLTTMPTGVANTVSYNGQKFEITQPIHHPNYYQFIKGKYQIQTYSNEITLLPHEFSYYEDAQGQRYQQEELENIQLKPGQELILTHHQFYPDGEIHRDGVFSLNEKNEITEITPDQEKQKSTQLFLNKTQVKLGGTKFFKNENEDSPFELFYTSASVGISSLNSENPDRLTDASYSQHRFHQRKNAVYVHKNQTGHLNKQQTNLAMDVEVGSLIKILKKAILDTSVSAYKHFDQDAGISLQTTVGISPLKSHKVFAGLSGQVGLSKNTESMQSQLSGFLSSQFFKKRLILTFMLHAPLSKDRIHPNYGTISHPNNLEEYISSNPNLAGVDQAIQRWTNRYSSQGRMPPGWRIEVRYLFNRPNNRQTEKKTKPNLSFY